MAHRNRGNPAFHETTGFADVLAQPPFNSIRGHADVLRTAPPGAAAGGGEAAALRLEQRHAWIHGAQSKNRRPIAVPLNDAALAVLHRQAGKHVERVFTYRGKPLNAANTRAWGLALDRAGIADFRWHDLRHTWATWQRQAGTPTHELQRLGGWRTGAMVERYAHLAPEHLAVAASRLDAVLAGYDLATVSTNEKRPGSLQAA